MLSERTIINALILAASLILGPYLTVTTFQAMMHHGSYAPILIFSGVTFLLIVFFFVGNRICVLPILGLAFAGNLDFLPLGLNAGELCTAVTILYYVITYVVLKQQALKSGPRALLYPILIIGIIVVCHQRHFGIHAFGGNEEGSRPAVLVLACITCYICAINIANPPINFLRHLPWYCLAVGFISGIPYIITTYDPESANTLIYLTSSINISAYSGESIVRQSTQALLGASLQTVLLAYFPIYTWWRPERWWAAILSLFCFWLVLHGGYRSGMMLYGVSFMLGTWCYCSWRSLILVPPLAVVVLSLGLAQSSNLVSLPLSVQRSLSFLPGDWDPDVKESAVSSNEFRDAIQRIYMQDDFAKSPLFGNGFSFDINELHAVQDKAAMNEADAYYPIKVFVVGKLFHIGWISVYDAVGIVGSLAFVMLGVNIAYLSGRFMFGQGRERQSPFLPLRIWIFCNVTRDMIGYFTVFGSFSQTFTEFCAYAIVLVHLRELERKPEGQFTRPPEHELFGLPKLGTHAQVEPLNQTSR